MKDTKPKNIFLKPLKLPRIILIILAIVFIFSCLFSVFNFGLLIDYNKKLETYSAAVKVDAINKPSQASSSLPLDLPPAPPTVPNEVLSNLVETVSNFIIQPEIITSVVTKNTTETKSNVQTILNSFGDGFSGLAFIDREKTTMNWDENTTAFTFPPIYNFTKENRLINSNVASDNSLKVLNNKLYYFDKKINLPAELSKENILNIKVSLVGNTWLVGIVTGKDFDERGWAYSFNGKDFTPIITSTSKQKIEPKFGRLGGSVTFGGSSDNFLIIYGGYDAHVLYYYKGAVTDISSFLNLRLSDGGFTPQIISRENSRGTLFYICSQTEGKPKFIKFWPKQKGVFMGSFDFTPLIFNNLGVSSASCEFQDNDILINLKKNDGSLETWRFADQGFDNSQDREVTSLDLGQNRSAKIKSAIISEMHLASDDNMFEVFFTNSGNTWQKIKPYVWQEFSTPNNSLFWRATFKAEPNSPDYSPWFDDINRLDYKTY